MRRLNIVSRDEAMQPEDAAHALTVLNLMMFGFTARGLNRIHEEYTSSDVVQVPDELQDGLIQLLAVRLAPDMSVAAPTSDGFDFKDWWDTFLAFYSDYEEATFDLALTQVPSQRRY